MTKTILAIVVAASAFGASADAQAAPAMRQAGTLTCALDPSVGFVVGSVRQMTCTYDRYDRRGRVVRETYAGVMNRAGFDVGVTSDQTVAWAVVTPGGRSGRSMLAGRFTGSSSDATLVAGPGTLGLFGENGAPVALQPVGNSGQVGLGLGFGATALDLRRVPAAAYTSYRAY